MFWLSSFLPAGRQGALSFFVFQLIFTHMKRVSELQPVILTIFGGDGDLAWRKLIPALFNLFIDGFLPEKFKI